MAEALKEAIATYEALFCLWEERGPGKTLANYMWWRNLGSAYSQLRYVTMDVGDSETRVRMRRAYKRYLEASERGGIRLSKKLRNDLEAVIEGRVPY